jgi:dienelactone hydrolase
VANISEGADERPPSLWLLAREPFALLARIYRAFGRLGPFGPEDGPPVLVVPGFLATDRTTLGLQRALGKAGYRVTGTDDGLNRGAQADTLDRLARRIETFSPGRKVILVGWSLGGVFAREVAKLRPDLVEAVVTLGSPFSSHPRANNVWRVYEMVSGHKVDEPPIPTILSEKPPVPTLAIWSRGDGIVAPAAARGKEGERDKAVELGCSHMGFATSARAYPGIIAAMREFGA